MATTLKDAYPQLFTTDMTRAVSHYRDVLGFVVVFLAGEPPFYGQVARDGARLNLRHVDVLPFAGDIRAREELLSAYIAVGDIAALDASFRAKGAAYHLPLATRPWGTREFILRDPDGNLLCFGEA